MITIKTQQGDKVIKPIYAGTRFCVHPVHTEQGFDNHWLTVTEMVTGLCLWQSFPSGMFPTVCKLTDWLDDNFPTTLDNPTELRQMIDAQARAMGLEV